MKILQDSANPSKPPERDVESAGVSPERHPLVLWLIGNVRWIWPILVVSAVFAISWSDLRNIHYRQVREALHSQNPFWLSIAALLTVGNLAVMGLYDVVCLRDSHVPARQRWWVGTLAFAWSNFLTLGPLAGPAIRFWLYRPSGVNFALLRQAIVSIAAGFSTGLLLWVGVVALPAPYSGFSAFIVRVAAVFASAYLVGIAAHKIQRLRFWPGWVHALRVRWSALFALGALDWLAAFLVFECVLRSGAISITPGAAGRLFFLGQGIGLLSLIPGGLGSADAFWLSRLGAFVQSGAAALLTYRALYYVLPWCGATLMLLRRAVHGRVRWAGPARAFVGLLVVLSGAVILVSAATPALGRRMRLLKEIVPLPILETSHLASALIGLFLFVLARGVMKGYRDAYRTTLALLLAGSAASLLKGLDYEESIVLLLIAALVWTHSRLFTLPNRAGGTIIAVLAPLAVGISVFTALGFAAYDQSRFSGSLLLHFAHFAYTARFLRTLSVLLLSGLIIAVYVVLRRPYPNIPPAESDIQRSLAIHEKIGQGTNALMVLNRDKSIHFLEESGFCLYSTIGGFLIVFSDPVIPAGSERRFLSSVLQKAAELDRSLVFYQISAHWIPVLHDFGYSFFKLGEEAIVDLARFTIQGNKGKAMRNVLNRFRNDGYGFEVLSPDQVPARLPALKRISDEWLSSKQTREKQFSIGFFDEHYLCSFPCALVSDPRGDPVAFANVLPGPRGEEFSVDLMRYVPECPNGVMDFLFLKLFEWGKERGYKTFDLGMAPLATVGEYRQARIQERLANILFQHGEHWYNFRGLRSFKEKYDPYWLPRYLAYPAFWMWPQAVANTAALIAGGWRNVIFPTGAPVRPASSARAV